MAEVLDHYRHSMGTSVRLKHLYYVNMLQYYKLCQKIKNIHEVTI